SENIAQNGIYSVKYFLTKDGKVYTAESTLELLGLRGDIDWDDKITIGDVTALLTILSGKGVYPAQDLDDSEGITIGDVTALLSMLSGR
ncbi:MAG: hypothetical protein IJX08_01910, partial [Clostridia bacterium]|nr:hypothetical protein [Clostridia bacterium]